MRWYGSILLLISGALLAGTLSAQQIMLLDQQRSSSLDFDGDLAKLAARSPMQPVGLQADIAPDISIMALADLIFAERIKVFSVYTTRHQTKKKRYISGYSFSILGPARDDQVARAACQEQIPFLQDDLGPDEPLQAEDRRISKDAFLVLPAAQAKQWMDSPPRGVLSLKITDLVSEDTLSRDEQVMRNVLTLQIPTTGATQVPAGCEKYLSIRR